ncbi:MAG: pyridoxamine 5'-phosphate oxidase family protein [Acidimicrobiales bacterium]
MLMDHSGMAILDDEECTRLLQRATIGRVAVSIGAVPAVFPVNFALDEGRIVFRTSSGTKLAAATRHAVVAFEVDDFDPAYHEGWSVLAVGMAEEIVDDLQLDRVEKLPLAAWAPGPHSHFIAITPEFTSGRRILQELIGSPR